MTASWLVQMGWDAVVMQPGAIPADQTGMAAPARPPVTGEDVESCTPMQLAAREATVVDVGPSGEYIKGHIPGAAFALRSRFAEALPTLARMGRPLVLTSPDGVLARYAASDAADAIDDHIRVLAGGTAAWIAAGLPVESTPQRWISPPIDRYKRPYEGTDNARDAMQGYIDWELRLVAQLAADGISRFRVVTP
jgi:rhodanese-related sulfurtransferase